MEHMQKAEKLLDAKFEGLMITMDYMDQYTN